jgi:predicted nucleic acid-binding protein
VRAAGDLSGTCDLLSATGTAGNLVNDAYLGSLAAGRGFSVVTFDRDFERFPGVGVHLLGGGPRAVSG